MNGRRLMTRRFAAGLLCLLTGVPLAAGAPPTGSPAVVELPPLLVEAESLQQPRWRYGAVPGFDVLSSCSIELTDGFVRTFLRRRQQLQEILPADVLNLAALPVTLILVPKSQEAALSREIASTMLRLSAPSGSAVARPLPQLPLTDPDSVMVYYLLDDGPGPVGSAGFSFEDFDATEGPYAGMVLTPAFVRQLIQAQAPAPPPWFSWGIAGLYDADRFHPGALEFASDPWTSPTAAERLGSDPDAPRTLLPLSELFGPRPGGAAAPEYREVWRTEAQLFVRWALSGQIPDGARRLWTLAARAEREPIDEAVFRDCFGLGFSDARDALSDALPDAVVATLSLRPLRAAAAPRLRLRDATASEIHRVRGEWSRRAFDFVRSRYPKYASVYGQRSRAYLETAVRNGETDPNVLATLGLLLAELRDPGARGVVARAAAAGATRPLALGELAVLDLGRALQRPAGAGGALSEAQAAGILDEVDAALRESPPLAGTYAVAAEVAEHLGRPPSAAELARLDRGARLFPAEAALVLVTAAWERQAGDSSEARRLIGLSLARCANPAVRARLTAALGSAGP